MDHDALHERARHKGVNPIVYRIVRGLLVPFFLLYFRLDRIGREHIPREGAAIIAANHRSFLDPFVIGAAARRPLYYVAKKELFARPWQAWLLNALGAFPVDRGRGDADTIDTAKAILARGDIVLIFPEGTRVRPGGLGKPRKGVGRLVLETGAPVVPVAVIGTEAIRRGWRIRPHKVRIRIGRPLQFPHVEQASPQLAATVTGRIWPCVMLQWEWLGGLAPIRRAAVIGAGHRGTSLAIALSRAGYEVDLGCRTAEQTARLAASRVNEQYLPGVMLPDEVHVTPASQLDPSHHDLVCLAVPARALPGVLAAHGGRIPQQAGLLVVSQGLVPPLGTLPVQFAADRTRARAVAVLGGPATTPHGAGERVPVMIGAADRGFSRQLVEVFGAAGFDVAASRDVIGAQYAGCAQNVALLAATVTAGAGADVAAATADRVRAEIEGIARAEGAHADTFARFATGAELAAEDEQIPANLGNGPEAADSVALLAARAHALGQPALALDLLAALVAGRLDLAGWTEALDAAGVDGRVAGRDGASRAV